MTTRKRDSEETDPAGGEAPADDLRLLRALRAGDEAGFVSLLDRYQPSLVRLALMYVGDRAVADEVVQETWLGVLQGLEGFRAESSLKTWIFRILSNRAKTYARREDRSVPFSSLPEPHADGAEFAIDPDRFFPRDQLRSGHWAYPPRHWDKTPEEIALSRETSALLEEAVASLPLRQREVITLRDIEGLTADEVCDVLGITASNQRVLLHRARSRVRRALERYLDGGAGPA